MVVTPKQGDWQPDLPGLERDLRRLESELRQLEIEYTKYFGGQTKRPPLAQRARVAAILRRWNRIPMPWSTARFRFNTIQGRYRTFADLWDRAMRAREDGRPGPFSHKS